MPVLVLALVLDAAFGEPEALWRRVPHPVVLIGRAIAALERRLNRGGWRRLRGLVALALLLVPLGAGARAVEGLPGGALVSLALAAVLLAQRSLAEHVGAVADGLGRSLDDGRQAVAMIVGRETATLDAPGVARAAIESAAENLSDGVVAPAFWFAVAGLPGIVLYKAVNTADSMIGHRTPRHREFGWAAARLDDALNLVPARLTAGLIALAGPSPRALGIAWRDAARHRSPNAGWPEAAMAACLGLALAGPRSYGGTVAEEPWLNPEGRRDARAADIRGAVALMWRAWALLLALAVGGTVLGQQWNGW